MKEKTEKLFYNSIRIRILSVLIICLIGFIVYSNTFQCSWHLDDETSIITNLGIRNLSNLKAVWGFCPTQFITSLSLAVNYRLGQFNVFGYHTFNLIIHIFSAVLVWWFVLLTFSSPGMQNDGIKRYSKQLSLLTGLVFLAHPLQTEAVTYIVQRSASMATLFYIGSLCLYAKSRLETRHNTIYYTGSLVVMVLAMFTKEISVTIPLIILLYEYCFLKQKTGICWKKIVPFLLCILIIPLTMLFTKSVGRIGGEAQHISAFHYFLTQFRVKITFIRLLLIPINQNLDYDYPIYRTLFNIPTVAGIIILFAILITAVRIFRRYKLISFGIFWFFITLLPESSILPLRDVIFEHRLYLPMAGFSIFLVCAIYYLFENKEINPAIVILIAIISVYSILTYNRNLVWKDEFTLWDDNIRKAPLKARPYNGRGLAYQKNGNFDLAMADYDKAIQLDPFFCNPYSNRGIIYQNKGDLNSALTDFNAAIKLEPADPKGYNNRGLNYILRGNFDSAINDFNKAIQIDNYFAGAYYNRGLAYQKKGEFDLAISDYNKAIQLEPNFAEAYNNRGTVYFDRGEYGKCLSDINKATALGYKVREEFLNEIIKRAKK